MSVSSREQAKEKYSKKMQDYVNRFGYYSANVRESCEVGSGGKTIQQINHLTASIASN